VRGKKNGGPVGVEVSLFRKPKGDEKQEIAEAGKRFGEYLGREAQVNLG
jgi:hypothetical protein